MNGVGLHMTRAFAPQAAPTRRSSLSKMPNAGSDASASSPIASTALLEVSNGQG